MNKRIKELAIEANMIAPEPNGFDRTSLSKSQQKFAELIVKECMNIARNVAYISEPDDWALDKCYEIEQRIQDRFGVEE